MPHRNAAWLASLTLIMLFFEPTCCVRGGLWQGADGKKEGRPMRSSHRILAAIAEGVMVLACVYFEPTHCVRGWMRGEALFHGRPTSYWRSLIDADMRQDPKVLANRA